MNRTTTASAIPADNRLLAALPAADLDRLEPCLEAVDLPAGRCVERRGEGPATGLHFLTAGIAGVAAPSRDAGDIAMVGPDGALGLSLVLHDGTPPLDAVMRVGGRGLTLPARHVPSHLAPGGALQTSLLGFALGLMGRIGALSACHRGHSLRERLAGWLRCALPRIRGDELAVSPATLAASLGQAAEDVDQAIGGLCREGIVEWRSGGLRVLDAARLAGIGCTCYGDGEAPGATAAPARPTQ